MFIRYTSKSGVQSNVTTDGDADRIEKALKYIVDAHPGEPLFCLRGRDLLLLPTISYYETLVRGLGKMQSEKGSLLRGPVIEGVQADYAAALAWQGANGPHMKYPDRPIPKG